MHKSQLLFETSPWFILACIFIGGIYAFTLYYKKGPWDRNTNYLLAFLRFLLVTILSILILGPLVERVKNAYAPPVYVLAFDNSESVSLSGKDSVSGQKTVENILQLSQNLKEEGNEIVFRSFDKKDMASVKEELVFNYPTSDIQSMLKSIQSDYEGRNLAGIVLVSDGIYNQGISPEYASFGFPVYTIGVGDTIPKIDVNLKSLSYNKVSYQGNKFPLVAEIQHNGFRDRTIKLNIERQGKTIASQSVKLDDEGITEVRFLLEAEQKGLQHYVVKIDTVAGEFSAKNNVKNAYVEIVEGKEKILLAAAAPNPDIKAILAALEQNQNYEVTTYIAGVQEVDDEKLFQTQFDVQILYQLPFKGAASLKMKLDKIVARDIPRWFILGSQSNLSEFNNLNTGLNIIALNNEKDQVFPSVSSTFSAFQLGDAYNEAQQLFPFIDVPYGTYNINGDAQVLLNQKIGKVITEKPLMLFSAGSSIKTAVFAGEGLWKWRIQEFAKKGASKGFEDFVNKTIQYLSAKEDKRRFKVYPVQNEFNDTEPVVFETEIYNEIFEPVFNQKINLEIIGEKGQKRNYEYVPSSVNSSYRISGLPEGLYQFTASTNLGGKKYTSKGQFSVSKLDLESVNLTANHTILKKLSTNTRGKFYLPNDIAQLQNDLLAKEAKSIIYSEEQYLPIIDIWWVFLVLLVLISAEWFVRKYNGSY